MSLKIVPMKDVPGKFVIVDKNDKVVDDAQGYGYTTKRKAEKASWYKFKGGKQKIDNEKKEGIEFWKNNEEFAKDVKNYYEWNFKEICAGLDDDKEDITEMAKKMKIDSFKMKYVEYLDIF